MIPRPGDHARNEITVLRLAAGDGCARLLRADEARGALLLERLGRPLVRLGLPLARRHEILCDTAARIWRPAPASGLPTGADKGRWLSDFITATWLELDRPCSARAVEYALACAARLAWRAGLDPTAIWEWGAAERVATGLLCTRIGLQPVGREMLATAEYVSRYWHRGKSPPNHSGRAAMRTVRAITSLSCLALYRLAV